MRSLRRLGVCLVVLAGACSETSRTQVMVRVLAEDEVVADTSRLEIDIFGRVSAGDEWDSKGDIQVRPATFPYDVALIPQEQSASRQFRVDVRALASDGSNVVLDRLIGSYADGETLLVELLLEARCRGVECTNVEQGCAAGACVAAFEDPSTYEPFTPADGSVDRQDGGPFDGGRADTGNDSRDGQADDAMLGDGSMDGSLPDGGADTSLPDTGTTDGGTIDTSLPDTGTTDGGTVDVGPIDGGTIDAGTRDSGSVDGAGSDASPTDASPTDAGVDSAVCMPGERFCMGDVASECGPAGTLINEVPCVLGCHPTEARCSLLDPSNALAPYYDQTFMDGMDVIAAVSLEIDTDTGSVLADGVTNLAVPSVVILGSPVDVRVFLVDDFNVGDVTVRGAAALAIVAAGDVTTNGTFQLLHTGAGTPGAWPAGAMCGGGDGNGGPVSGGGGGGGGGGRGARGGHGGLMMGNRGGSGGTVAGPLSIEPLVGGCPGGSSIGRGNGGPGGGALQIVSATRIDITGILRASGAGAPAGAGGGGGGGSVLLEAPLVTLAGTGIYANGGGGACRGNGGGDGFAQGGTAGICTTPGIGNGGRGGWLANPPGRGADAVTAGGGGGGGAGRIRINTADGSFSTAREVSPAVSVGQLATR